MAHTSSFSQQASAAKAAVSATAVTLANVRGPQELAVRAPRVTNEASNVRKCKCLYALLVSTWWVQSSYTNPWEAEFEQAFANSSSWLKLAFSILVSKFPVFRPMAHVAYAYVHAGLASVTGSAEQSPHGQIVDIPLEGVMSGLVHAELEPLRLQDWTPPLCIQGTEVREIIVACLSKVYAENGVMLRQEQMKSEQMLRQEQMKLEQMLRQEQMKSEQMLRQEQMKSEQMLRQEQMKSEQMLRQEQMKLEQMERQQQVQAISHMLGRDHQSNASLSLQHILRVFAAGPPTKQEWSEAGSLPGCSVPVSSYATACTVYDRCSWILDICDNPSSARQLLQQHALAPEAADSSPHAQARAAAAGARTAFHVHMQQSSRQRLCTGDEGIWLQLPCLHCSAPSDLRPHKLLNAEKQAVSVCNPHRPDEIVEVEFVAFFMTDEMLVAIQVFFQSWHTPELPTMGLAGTPSSGKSVLSWLLATILALGTSAEVLYVPDASLISSDPNHAANAVFSHSSGQLARAVCGWTPAQNPESARSACPSYVTKVLEAAAEAANASVASSTASNAAARTPEQRAADERHSVGSVLQSLVQCRSKPSFVVIVDCQRRLSTSKTTSTSAAKVDARDVSKRLFWTLLGEVLKHATEAGANNRLVLLSDCAVDRIIAESGIPRRCVKVFRLRGPSASLSNLQAALCCDVPSNPERISPTSVEEVAAVLVELNGIPWLNLTTYGVELLGVDHVEGLRTARKLLLADVLQQEYDHVCKCGLTDLLPMLKLADDCWFERLDALPYFCLCMGLEATWTTSGKFVITGQPSEFEELAIVKCIEQLRQESESQPFHSQPSHSLSSDFLNSTSGSSLADKSDEWHTVNDMAEGVFPPFLYQPCLHKRSQDVNLHDDDDLKALMHQEHCTGTTILKLDAYRKMSNDIMLQLRGLNFQTRQIPSFFRQAAGNSWTIRGELVTEAFHRAAHMHSRGLQGGVQFRTPTVFPGVDVVKICAFAKSKFGLNLVETTTQTLQKHAERKAQGIASEYLSNGTSKALADIVKLTMIPCYTLERVAESDDFRLTQVLGKTWKPDPNSNRVTVETLDGDKLRLSGPLLQLVLAAMGVNKTVRAWLDNKAPMKKERRSARLAAVTAGQAAECTGTEIVPFDTSSHGGEASSIEVSGNDSEFVGELEYVHLKQVDEGGELFFAKEALRDVKVHLILKSAAPISDQSKAFFENLAFNNLVSVCSQSGYPNATITPRQANLPISPIVHGPASTE